MPRGGPPTYTYSLPAIYLAVPGTLITAAQHNTPLEDIATTFNTAWPINLGGTGGTSRQTAIESLFDGTTYIVDEDLRIAAVADPTKILEFDLANLTASRTLDAPDRSGTIGVPTVDQELSTTSGTSKSFSVPSTVRQVTFNFYGVSTNGSSVVVLRLGDSGGVETTGYVCCSTQLFATTTGFSTDAYTTGFGIRIANAATAVLSGSVTFTRSHVSDSVWIASGVVADTANTGTCTLAGSKLLDGTLTTVMLTTINGTDEFDAGAVDIFYS